MHPYPSIARVARIPYLNAAPFFVRWTELGRASEGRWVDAVMPPRQLGDAAAAGEVDAGLMAAADLVRLESDFEPLVTPGAPHGFGIANRERVDSVLFFLRDELCDSEEAGARIPTLEGNGFVRADLTPAEAGRLRGARIAVTVETATSIRLLRMLVDDRFEIEPIRYERADLSDPTTSRPDIAGALVIGDDALRWRVRPPEGLRQRIDLAAAWQGWTGRPFVFARWAVRRALPEPAKRWLAEFLEVSLELGAGRLSELAADAAPALGTSPSALARYLREFTYPLTPEEIPGHDEFARRLHGVPSPLEIRSS